MLPEIQGKLSLLATEEKKKQTKNKQTNKIIQLTIEVVKLIRTDGCRIENNRNCNTESVVEVQVDAGEGQIDS